MNILGANENFFPDFLVCPKCNSLSHDVTPVGSRITGNLLGYYMVCSGCEAGSLIHMQGGPPLFDLSKKIQGSFA